MNLSEYLFHTSATVTESDAEQLQHSSDWYTVEIQPPVDQELPATLPRFIYGILELQNKFLGLGNASPTAAFEIRRHTPSNLRFQISVPTKRLERKVRTHLTEEIPQVGFQNGVDGLPITQGDTIGGGLLTTGRHDIYPLKTSHEQPMMNSVAAALHRHAMQNTRFVIQILFQPQAGQPVKNRLWKRKAYKQLSYLRKEKTEILPWHDRPATPREKQQADEIEHKAGNPRFKTSIRILLIGADEYTPSRVKEVAGAFRNLESADTGQYLDEWTVKSLIPSKITEFAEAVNQRRFKGWSRSFQTSPQELAALLTVPDRQQENISYSQP